MSDSTERETIIGRIKTLFERTVENGCTEAEAIAAALAAQRLIARYDVTDAELSEPGTVRTSATCPPQPSARQGRLPCPLGRGPARNLRRVIAHSDVVCYNATNVVFTRRERT